MARYLKLISDESLIIDAVDGNETIADAIGLFTYISPYFKDWGTDEPEQPTTETPVILYELCKDADFSQMFSDLSTDMCKLSLTQNQIKNFVKKYRRQYLWVNRCTFFLFKSQDKFFVAYVDVYAGDELYARMQRFGHSHVWNAACHHRLVIPQL